MIINVGVVFALVLFVGVLVTILLYVCSMYVWLLMWVWFVGFCEVGC